MVEMIFKERTELNAPSSAFTGNVMAFYGKSPAYFKSCKIDATLTISDCHSSIRLHPEGMCKKNIEKTTIKKLRLSEKPLRDMRISLKRLYEFNSYYNNTSSSLHC